MHHPNVSKVSIPQGAAYPHFPTPSAPSPMLVNPWEEWDFEPVPYQGSAGSTYGDPSSAFDSYSHSPRYRTQSTVSTNTTSGPFAFPEPQHYRSESRTPGPEIYQRPRSDYGILDRNYSTRSVASTTSSYYEPETPIAGAYEQGIPETPAEETAPILDSSLDYDERLQLFQKGSLPESEQDWHRLAPPEALEALGEQEVQRQSVLFELCKSEMDYVSDLQAVKDVFIDPLRDAKPPVINKPGDLSSFIAEVFGNLDELIALHRGMLKALFNRQRDQHPLVQSFADIILDTILKAEFRSAYDTYIKNYPLAESKHRRELTRNPAYQTFIQNAAHDPRIRKRDLVTFLSRPVTRLPRLNLLLETILKRTDKNHDHPDLETLPMILSILTDSVKGTQPGIEAAEAKVKFWALCESLVYQKGEIIDIDLYDPSRTLVYAGALARKCREEWVSWSDLNVALLDNYLLLTREEKRQNGSIKRLLTSRPIPLSYLRLGTWDEPAETRKERLDEGGLLDRFRHDYRQVYPFTVYHASSQYNRRYTLYAPSEAVRGKWRTALVDAIAVHKARQDGNMWFQPKALTDSFFALTSRSGKSKVTGKPSSAVSFSIKGRKYIAVSCPTGIYVGAHATPKFTKVLPFNATSIAALQTLEGKTFNKFLLLHEGSLFSYPLDMMVYVHLGQIESKSLLSSQEKLPVKDGNITFFRAAKVMDRVLVIYASKRTLLSTSILSVLEVVDNSKVEQGLSPNRLTRMAGSTPSYRVCGEPGYVPKSAFDVIPLVKTIAIVTGDGLRIADPTNIAQSNVTVVPDFSQSSSNPAMAALKARLDDSSALGFVRCQRPELLVVYQAGGFYVDKHGRPSRNSGYIKWETHAQSFAHRGPHVLLISPSFIEIRDVNTARLVQVVEGQDIRLLHSGPKGGVDKTIMVSMRAEGDVSIDTVVELTETSPVNTTPSAAVDQNIWAEWDTME